MPSSITHALTVERCVFPNNCRPPLPPHPKHTFWAHRGRICSSLPKRRTSRRATSENICTATRYMICFPPSSTPFRRSAKRNAPSRRHIVSAMSRTIAPTSPFIPLSTAIWNKTTCTSANTSASKTTGTSTSPANWRGARQNATPSPTSRCARRGALLSLWEKATRALGRTPMDKSTLYGGIDHFASYLAFFHKKCYASHRNWRRFDRLFHIHGLSCFYPAKTPDEAILSGAAF